MERASVSATVPPAQGHTTPQIGATFPQTEFGNDPAAIKDYAQAVEGMGYGHIVAYDHVLGANPNRPEWQGR